MAGQTTVAAASRPFESGADLRRANLQLLQQLNERLGHDTSMESERAAVLELEPRIREFLARGLATGAVIDDPHERTACQVTVDYWASTLSRTGAPIWRDRLAPFDAERLPDLTGTRCPFVDLDAFTPEPYRHFFGRQTAVADLLDRVATTPLVVVHGASGSGKSALVMAGVLPVLGATGHEPAFRTVGPFTPGKAVLERLVNAIRGSQGDAGGDTADLHADPRSIVRMVGGVDAPALLLVIDQFDEVFTLCGERARLTLTAAIVELLNSRPADRVILVMRTEFEERLKDLLPPALLTDRALFDLGTYPMQYQDLKAVVEGPAALVNLQFQPGIVDDLVKSVLAAGETALPLLQFALKQLWDARERNRITWDVYRRVVKGDPLKALESFADGIYHEGMASAEMRAEFDRILTELVRVTRVLEVHRQQVLRTQLVESGRESTNDVLRVLEENDFIRSTPTAGGDEVVELTYEALLRNWPHYKVLVDQKREQAGRHVRLADAAHRWKQGGGGTRGLLSVSELADARSLTGVDELEQAFVAASEKAVARAARWQIALRFAAAAVCLGVIAAYLWMAHERRYSQETALRRQMADARAAAIAGRLDHAVRDALQAAAGVQALARPDPGLTFDARATLLSLLQHTGDVRGLFMADQAVFQTVAFQPGSDDGVVAYAGSGGKVYLAAVNRAIPVRVLDTCPRLVTSMAFDPSGRWLAATCVDGAVYVQSMTDLRQPPIRKELPDARALWTLAFSPDGRILAVGGLANKLTFFPLGAGVDPLAAGWFEGTIDRGPAEIGLPSDDRAAKPPSGGIWAMAFAPGRPVQTQHTLLAGDDTGRIFVCQPKPDESWSCRDSMAYRPDSNPVRSIAFSPTGDAVVIGRWLGDVHAWDSRLSPGSMNPVDVSQLAGPAISLRYVSDCHVAIGKGSGLLYRVATPRPSSMPDPAGPPPCPAAPLASASVGDEVPGLAFDERSGTLAAATRGGYVALLDPKHETDRLATVVRLETPQGQVRAAVVDSGADRLRMAVAVNPDAPSHRGLGSLEVITLSRGDGPIVVQSRRHLLPGIGRILRLSASTSRGLLATLTADGRTGAQIAVWRLNSDASRADRVGLLGKEQFRGLVPRRIGLSPNGDWLVASLGRESGAPPDQLEQWCAGESAARELLVVHLADGWKQTWVDSGFCSGFHAIEIAFSDDGRLFAAGGDFARNARTGPGGMKVWTVGGSGLRPSKYPELTLSQHANRVQEVGFAKGAAGAAVIPFWPAGSRRLALAAGDYGELDAWDLSNDSPHPVARRVDSLTVWLLAHNAEGAMVAASDKLQVVRVWSTILQNSEPVRLSSPGQAPASPGFLTFTTDGDWLVSTAGERDNAGTLTVWDLGVRSLTRQACALWRGAGPSADPAAPPWWRDQGICTFK